MDYLNPVDVYVGARIRAIRVFRNCELWQLASAIAISDSHLVEYEVGTARCSSEHLAAIAETLNVRSCLFFNGLRRKVTRAKFPVSSKMLKNNVAVNDNLADTDRKQFV